MSKKILIIDDEQGIRESLKLILGDYYELILTDNGESALDILAHDSTIGLILLDIKMPQINGIDLLKTIKEKYREMKVIMVTGYNSVETAAEATATGACGYIVKPFESKEILDKVEKNIT